MRVHILSWKEVFFWRCHKIEMFTKSHLCIPIVEIAFIRDFSAVSMDLAVDFRPVMVIDYLLVFSWRASVMFLQIILAKWKSRPNEEGLELRVYFSIILLWVQHHHRDPRTGDKKANLDKPNCNGNVWIKCPGACFLGRGSLQGINSGWGAVLSNWSPRGSDSVVVLLVWKDPQGVSDIFSSLEGTKIWSLLLYYPRHETPVLWWHLLGIRVKHEN